MKIVEVIGTLGNGGAEKLVVELSNELALKHDVLLISLKKGAGWENPAKRIAEKVRYLELKRKKGLDLGVLLKLFQTVRKKKPDIVHIHLNLPLQYFLFIIPFFPAIHFVFTIHSTFKTHKNFFTKLSKYPFSKKISYVCLSREIHTNFEKHFPKYNFSVIENGIKSQNIQLFDEEIQQKVKRLRKEYKYIFLSVGRLAYAKNIPLLLNVFSDEHLHQVKLLLIGDGDASLKKRIQEAAVMTYGRIEYLGKQEKVLDYMQNVDAFILTSHHEGMPITLIEALSVGLPVVSTAVGGIPDMIVDGENGFLSDAVSREKVLKAVHRFIQLDEKQIRKMKEKNRQLFQQRFSMEVCAAHHEKLYHQLVSHG